MILVKDFILKLSDEDPESEVYFLAGNGDTGSECSIDDVTSVLDLGDGVYRVVVLGEVTRDA